MNHALPNPEWTAHQQRTTQEFTQMVLRNHERAMAELHDIYDKFTRGMAENQRQWSNILNREEDVRNPSTGETFKVAAGHNYYWQRGNSVIGTTTASAPDIDLTPLEKY